MTWWPEPNIPVRYQLLMEGQLPVVVLPDPLAQAAIEGGAEDAVPSEHWAYGGAGARDLAEAVMRACELPKHPRLLYSLDLPIKDKIELLATQVYGADGVDYTPEAEDKIAQAETQAANEVRSVAADVATRAAEAVLKTETSGAGGAALVDQGIKDIGRLLH